MRSATCRRMPRNTMCPARILPRIRNAIPTLHEFGMFNIALAGLLRPDVAWLANLQIRQRRSSHSFN
jgi:hypothetical protein